jgi:hypothetical protein
MDKFKGALKQAACSILQALDDVAEYCEQNQIF